MSTGPLQRCAFTSSPLRLGASTSCLRSARVLRSGRNRPEGSGERYVCIYNISMSHTWYIVDSIFILRNKVCIIMNWNGAPVTSRQGSSTILSKLLFHFTLSREFLSRLLRPTGFQGTSYEQVWGDVWELLRSGMRLVLEVVKIVQMYIMLTLTPWSPDTLTTWRCPPIAPQTSPLPSTRSPKRASCSRRRWQLGARQPNQP